MFKVFYVFMWLVMWLPLRVLYLFSDFFFVIIYFLAGYRKKVVRRNLERSFPEKSKKELRRIELRFYRYFCDLFIETFYMMHMSEKEARKRIQFVNAELLVDQYTKGKSVLLMSAHYGNWEWISSLSLVLPDDFQLYGIYKRLNNKDFDRFMQQIRSKFNSDSIETQDVFRTMVRERKEGKLAIYGMISDQSPWIGNVQYWQTFLNQDSPVIIGTEHLAKKLDYPVVYIHIDRIKRGYYKCEFFPVSLDPTNTTGHEITDTYLRILERKIIEKPEYWIWSHNRWKHTRASVEKYNTKVPVKTTAKNPSDE